MRLFGNNDVGGDDYCKWYNFCKVETILLEFLDSEQVS